VGPGERREGGAALRTSGGLARGRGLAGAVRRGRFVALRSVREADLPFLFALLTDPVVGTRWRFRGAQPRPEAFERLLWDGVLTQLLVEGAHDNIARGLVSCYGANLNSGTANVAVALVPGSSGVGLGTEAFVLFLDYLFSTWTLRKCYLEVPAFNLRQFSSAVGRYFHLEGVLRAHEYYGGRWYDSAILACYRDDLRRFYAEHPRLAPSGPDGLGDEVLRLDVVTTAEEGPLGASPVSDRWVEAWRV
jgi:RimJ/RimL family protein N-acetyltransferase